MEELDRFAQAWETQLGRRHRARAGWHVGVRASPNLVRVVDAEPMLTQPDPLAMAREAMAAAPEARKPAMGRLAAGLAEWVAFAASAGAETRWRAQSSEATVRLDREVIFLADAEVELATCLDTERRRGLGAGIQEARAALEPLEAEIVQRRLEVLASRSLLSDSVWGGLCGVDLARWTTGAESLLRASEGAYQEALDFRLRRERLPPSGRAEIELALELVSLREHGPSAWLEGAAGAVAEGLGIELRRRRRLALDLEPRQGRERGSLVAPFAIPGEVAVAVTPLRTPGDLDRLLHALGMAWHWTGIDGDLSISDRVTLDLAQVEASGALIASILEMPAWHRRVLRLPSRTSDEMARAFALRHLAALRQAAARFLVAQELRAHGPTSSVQEGFRARLGQAMGADWGTRGWLLVDPLDPAAELRGLAQATALGAQLEEHFNEDWWRNPHSGEWLEERWSRGGGLGTIEPDLDVAWKRLAQHAVG